MTLALAAGALIPAALAWACNPQAYLTLDKSQYAPGDSLRVSGSFFRGDTDITVSLGTGQSATVKTSPSGSFQTTFTLPASTAPGGYTVSAIGYESNGDVINGLPARASFSVAAAQPAEEKPAPPSAASPQAGEPAAQPAQPQTGQSSALPATRPTQPRPTGSPNASGFREPSVTREPDVQTSRATPTARRRATSGGTTATPGGTAATPDRASVGGRAVFGGSVAPATGAIAAPPVAAAAPRSSGTRATGGTRPASRSGAVVGRQAAEQTATDDVWGALNPARSPSVLPSAGDGVAVSSPRSGSQLALGLLLLGAGVLALVAGLAAGEARRRRVRLR